ncbi:hypothetical protein CBS147337_3447 [Penicillium roqueforti]|nr:hypothetical protein CBS147337_3447 [Penicillium roqueforti]
MYVSLMDFESAKVALSNVYWADYIPYSSLDEISNYLIQRAPCVDLQRSMIANVKINDSEPRCMALKCDYLAT